MVGREAARAADLLLRVSSLPEGLRSLNAYRDRFLERYGPQAEVPLPELLDPQLGLGPLPTSSPTGAPWRPRSAARAGCSRWPRRRCRRARPPSSSTTPRSRTWAWSARRRTPSPPSSWPSPWPRPRARPWTTASSGSSVSPGIGSYAAGRILGRFAYLFGAEGEQALRSAAERQEAQTPGALAAESRLRPRPRLAGEHGHPPCDARPRDRPRRHPGRRPRARDPGRRARGRGQPRALRRALAPRERVRRRRRRAHAQPHSRARRGHVPGLPARRRPAAADRVFLGAGAGLPAPAARCDRAHRPAAGHLATVRPR